MSKNTSLMKLSVAAGALCLAAISQCAFTTEDLQKMVGELERYMVKYPEYTYPIKCTVDSDPEVNAYATVEFSEDENAKPQAVMVVHQGLVDFVKEDKNLIRAVVAHELAHLSKGHPTTPGFKPGDLNSLFIRQIELEADVVGASLLQASGHSKDDMIKLLLMLDKDAGKTHLMHNIGADHPTGASRAANIADNPLVYRSLADFQLGNAFMENRQYPQALAAYTRAIAKEPKFTEAYINKGQAALMAYYDKLPQLTKESWFRPDFGGILIETPVGSRAIVPDATDLRRYQEALSAINTAVEKAPDSLRAKELKYIAQVLDPEAKAENLSAGIAGFRELLTKSANEQDMLRYANNLAIGQQRSSDLKGAVTTMLTYSEKSEFYNQFLSYNLGMKGMSELDANNAGLALSMVLTWLNNSPNFHPDYNLIKDAYTKACTRLGYKIEEVKPIGTYLCAATTLTLGDNSISLFEPLEELFATLGKADNGWIFDETYPDMMEYRWNNRDFHILADKTDLYRITTYETGASIILRPQDKTMDGTYTIKVGMTKAEFEQVLPLSAATQVPFVRAGELETWYYYPSLLMGVCITDDKVSGLTVSPYKLR